MVNKASNCDNLYYTMASIYQILKIIINRPPVVKRQIADFGLNPPKKT